MKDKVELHKIELKIQHLYGFGFCNIAWAEIPEAGKYKLIIYYAHCDDEIGKSKLDAEYPELAKLGRFCMKSDEEKEGLGIELKLYNKRYWQAKNSVVL